MILKSLCVAFLAILLIGCNTNPAKDVAFSESEIADKPLSPDVTYTISELQTRALTNPTDSEPWARMAKTYFDEGRYGQALVAADEALQRNPGNASANAIWVKSSLRLATKGVRNMKNDAKLKAQAKPDAQALSNEMGALNPEADVLGAIDTQSPKPIVYSNKAGAPKKTNAGASKVKPKVSVSADTSPVVRPNTAPSSADGSPGRTNPFERLMK